MTVDLPSAVIGVRGTQVAGLLDENGEGDVVLIGRPNSFGVTPGAITVANDFGTQDVLRGGFAVGVSPNTAPTAPVPAPAELLDRVEQAVQELAGEEIAEEVAAELADPQTVALLEALVEAGVEGPDDATNSVDVLAVVLGEDVAAEASEFGVGFTGEALYLLAQYANLQDLNQKPAGPSVTELANVGLVGSYQYTSNNITMTALGPGGGSGSFDSITTIDYSASPSGTLRAQILNGTVENIGLSNGNSASFEFSFDRTTNLTNLVNITNPDTGQAEAVFQSLANDNNLADGLSLQAAPVPTAGAYIDPQDPGAGTFTQQDVEQNTNTFGTTSQDLVQITNYSTMNTPTADDAISVSLSGNFVSLAGETGNLAAVNVSIETIDQSITPPDPDTNPSAQTITNLGGTGGPCGPGVST